MLNEFFYGSGEVTSSGELTRSLRFNSVDENYLIRTPSVESNRKTWTWSGWIKRSDLTRQKQLLFSVVIDASTRFNMFLEGDQILLFDRGSGTVGLTLRTGTTGTLFTAYRDPSSWFHLVVRIDTTQATSTNRAKIYINGAEIETYGDNPIYPNQNTDTQVNSTLRTTLGTRGYFDVADPRDQDYFDGYLADVHLIDGQALDPTSFGAFDNNGVWQAAKYTGTYGTNGFHLDFSDNSSAAALGADSSGNGNDFTVNNISVTAGAENDSLVDSPINSTQTDTGLGGEVSGNYCTLNPLHSIPVISLSTAVVLSNGNLDVTTSSDNREAVGTFGVSSGKWYYEVTQQDSGNFTNGVGWYKAGAERGESIYRDGGTFLFNGTSASYGASWQSSGDVIGIALDIDNSTISFYKNGVSQGDAKTDLSAGTYIPFVLIRKVSNLSVNFGQRPFAYPISGYKCLNTASLPEPTIPDGSKYFYPTLYTGNGSTQTIDGLDFSPDFVWIKERSSNSGHALFDIVRGTGLRLRSDGTFAETSGNNLTAFNSDGFTVGNENYTNENNQTYVGWCWDGGTETVTNNDGSTASQVRVNLSAGFSVVSYIGTGSNATVGHGLNAVPGLIMIKNRDDLKNWVVGHSALPPGNSLRLNLTNAVDNGGTIFNSTDPTNSVFSVGTNISISGSGDEIIAYCFAPVAGYSVFGSYTGNGSIDGPFIYTGFRPRWIMIKKTSGTANWQIFDTSRDINNIVHKQLLVNEGNAEFNLSNRELDILSNGFKIRSTSKHVNTSNGAYIYATFAENPLSINGGIAR